MKTNGMKTVAAGLAATLAWFAAGCGEDARTDVALAVNPVSADVYDKGATVVLTAFDPDAGLYD